MRYLFHVLGPGEVYLDEVGEQFSSSEEAEKHAVVIACELAREGDTYHGFEVYAIDGRAIELARVPVTALDFNLMRRAG